MFKNITTAAILLQILLFHTWLAVATDQRLLEDIKFEISSPQEERITFQLNGAYIPKMFAIKGERPRVVFDFPDTRTARVLKNTINTNGKFIKRIRIGIHNQPDPKTRVVFDLMPDKEIDFKQDFDQQKNTLIITVFHSGAEPENTPALRAHKKTAPADQPEATASPVAAAEDAHATGLTAPQHPAREEETHPDAQPQPPAGPIRLPPFTQHSAAQPSEPEPIAPPKPSTHQEKKAAPVPQEAAHVDKPASLTVLSSITFDDSTNRGEMILFKLNRFYSPIVFGVEEGRPRVVWDFKETVAADDIPTVIKADGKYVQTIRIGQEKTPQKVRVVLDLAPTNSYDLQQVFFKDDNLFVIIINSLHNTAPTQEPEKALQEGKF